MVSCAGLYSFLLFIMLYPVPAIDRFLEVNFTFSAFRSSWMSLVPAVVGTSPLKRYSAYYKPKFLIWDFAKPLELFVKFVLSKFKNPVALNKSLTAEGEICIKEIQYRTIVSYQLCLGCLIVL